MKTSVIYNKAGNIIDQDKSPSLKEQLRKLHNQGADLPEGWRYKNKIHNEDEIKSLCDEYGYPYPTNI